jgi:hypothetical protein
MHGSNILPQIINWKRREFNLETHLLFIDCDKGFDNLQRQILFNILKSRNIPDTFVMSQIWGNCLTQIWGVCWNISITPALLVLWNLWYAENNIACLKCYKTLGNTIADRLVASRTADASTVLKSHRYVSYTKST